MIASLFIIEHVHAYFISVENRQQDPDEFLPAVDEGTHEHQAFYRLKEAVLDKDACHEFTYPDEIKDDDDGDDDDKSQLPNLFPDMEYRFLHILV